MAHAMISGRAKTGSLRFMLSKPKSFFSWRQNRAKRSVQLRIFEIEARGAQPSGHYALTLQDRGIHHFAETHPQRKPRDRQHRRPMKGASQRPGELQGG